MVTVVKTQVGCVLTVRQKGYAQNETKWYWLMAGEPKSSMMVCFHPSLSLNLCIDNNIYIYMYNQCVFI